MSHYVYESLLHMYTQHIINVLCVHVHVILVGMFVCVFIDACIIIISFYLLA